MKKILCIVLAAIVLFTTPVRGYSAGVSLPFGIGEEIILPFLLSLLGVKAAESVDTYNDLVTYNEKIKGSLLEKVAGLAGMEQVQEWLFNVVNGVIDTDSVVWDKLYELAIDNYVVASSNNYVPSSDASIFDLPSFDYYDSDTFTISTSTSTQYSGSGFQKVIVYGFIDQWNNMNFVALMCSLSAWKSGVSSFTNDGVTIYYDWNQGQTFVNRTFSPQYIADESICRALSSGSNNIKAKACWLALNKGISSVSNISSYSDAYNNVLTSSEKDDIIDGSNVIQLYNPAELQNGLEIIPGGYPEDDPNLKKIPFAVTADWWNFLQQFGSGTNANQYVNAYNALNGLDNTSIGRISDAYDSLGIASIAGSAANASEGIISLTDDNIYPASQTAADAITNTIPGSLTPQTPDSGIDNESPQGLYKLPDLREYFPFCIPFDLIDLLRCFVAEPETPSFVLALSTGSEMSEQSFDLHMWDNIASMVRTFELVGFILGLILVTRNIIRG